MLEVEHLKVDDERMLRLLQKTSEYKGFADLCLDSAGLGTFMQQDFPAPGAKKGKENGGGKMTGKQEEDSWIPEAALKYAHKFRAKNSELSEKAIDQLLTELNKIWRDREKKQMARVKSTCNTQVADVKRGFNSTKSYSEVEANKKIIQLQADLKKANAEIRKHIDTGETKK